MKQDFTRNQGPLKALNIGNKRVPDELIPMINKARSQFFFTEIFDEALSMQAENGYPENTYWIKSITGLEEVDPEKDRAWYFWDDDEEEWRPEGYGF